MYEEQRHIEDHFRSNLNYLTYLNLDMKLNTSNSLNKTSINVPCIEAIRKRVDSL